MESKPIRPKNKFLTFGSPAIEEPEISEVIKSLKSGWLGTGPKVAQFEKDFGNYKRASQAIAVNSCTAALHLSMSASNLKPSDEVITSPMTFCATVNAIIHAGLKPVLADIDPVTMNINPEQIEQKITSKTKTILPVHFAGRACDMDAIMDTAKKYNLMVIEDCAHAIETEFHGKKAGTFGDSGCFSFYVTKNIVTGEGGMILTKDEEYATRIKRLALHGLSSDAWKRFSDDGYKHYFVTECGFKYNMTDLQAAIGIHQLKRIEGYWKRREHIWQRYNDAFADLPLVLPAEPEPDTRHAYHLYTILIDEQKCGISRDDFLNAMTANNIGIGVHYLSIPEHPFYQKKYGWHPEDYPNAMRIGRQTVSLPISAKLTDEDVEDVIKAVVKTIKPKIKKINTTRNFGDILDKYVVLKLPLNQYIGTTHNLGSDFQIAGAEVRERIRNDEKRFLSLYFKNWFMPYNCKLKGWRDNSPLYILHNGILISGIYLCDKNEFNEGQNWGQLHYFYTDPTYKKKGLHRKLIEHAIVRAKSWNLQGLIINTDRYLLPEVYMRWGAVPWKEVKKSRSFKSSSILKKFLKQR